jgi:hypothetical protein
VTFDLLLQAHVTFDLLLQAHVTFDLLLQAHVTLTSARRGDVQIYLISPGGTRQTEI